MSQSEMSTSAEDGDCIDAWPWVEPQQGEKGPTYRGQGRVPVAASQVSWVYALLGGRQVRLHTVTDQVYVAQGKLDSLALRWAEHGFVRIHDWFLVRWSHVRDLYRPPSGAWEISLNFGAGTRYLPVGVGYRRKITRAWAEHLDRMRDDRRRLFNP